MGKRRGFFAELNHQAAQAERGRRQQRAAAVRTEAAAARAAEKARRDAEKARRDSERARAAVARASLADRKGAEREAVRLHMGARLAEAAALNAELALQLEEIDTLLAATLEVDDFVDLESLKVPVGVHPPFTPGELAVPTPAQPPLTYPAEPALVEPAAPSGLSGALGGRRKHAEAVANARSDHQQVIQSWQRDCHDLYTAYLAEQQRLQGLEVERGRRLVQAQDAHRHECERRDAEARVHNERLDGLINDFAFDVPEAIEQYVDIVLSNSVYPESFPVSFTHEFDLNSRELHVTATVPEAGALPTTKEYRYVKAKDEITSTVLPVKAQKDRYGAAVWQVAVRTLHEVFEADRAAKIRSISLIVGVDRRSPGTGLPETVPLVQVAADRVTFTKFDLGEVVPAATLEHLGAAMSKSPFDLVPADLAPGVRVRKPT